VNKIKEKNAKPAELYDPNRVHIQEQVRENQRFNGRRPVY